MSPFQGIDTIKDYSQSIRQEREVSPFQGIDTAPNDLYTFLDVTERLEWLEDEAARLMMEGGTLGDYMEIMKMIDDLRGKNV